MGLQHDDLRLLQNGLESRQTHLSFAKTGKSARARVAACNYSVLRSLRERQSALISPAGMGSMNEQFCGPVPSSLGAPMPPQSAVPLDTTPSPPISSSILPHLQLASSWRRSAVLNHQKPASMIDLFDMDQRPLRYRQRMLQDEQNAAGSAASRDAGRGRLPLLVHASQCPPLRFGRQDNEQCSPDDCAEATSLAVTVDREGSLFPKH